MLIVATIRDKILEGENFGDLTPDTDNILVNAHFQK